MSFTPNTVYIETHRGSRRYDPMLLGQFLEHFHRQVYGGVFAPGSPLADARGFRECPERVMPYATERTIEHGEVNLPPHSISLIQSV